MFYPKICWLFNKTDEFSPLFKVICIYNTVITHLPCLGSRLPITTRETTFYHRVMLPHILKIVAELVKLTIIVLKLIVYMLQVAWIRVTGLFSSTARVINEEFILQEKVILKMTMIITDPIISIGIQPTCLLEIHNVCQYVLVQHLMLNFYEDILSNSWLMLS